MSGNNKEPMDVINQFIDKNKDALSEISFGGGTELIVVVMIGMRCNALQYNTWLRFFPNEKPSLCLWSCPVVYLCVLDILKIHLIYLYYYFKSFFSFVLLFFISSHGILLWNGLP